MEREREREIERTLSKHMCLCDVFWSSFGFNWLTRFQPPRCPFITSSYMASAADICTELADVQVSLESDFYRFEVKQKMVAGIATKIRGLKDANIASTHQVMISIKALNIDEALCEMLEAALNDRLAKWSSSTPKVEQQLLTNGLSYLTKADWIELDDPQAEVPVMSRTIQNRLALLGFRSFDEEIY